VASEAFYVTTATAMRISPTGVVSRSKIVYSGTSRPRSCTTRNMVSANEEFVVHGYIANTRGVSSQSFINFCVK
jgi:hypothetical protein